MYQNTIYICISRYSKICWFPVKKCWCKQNSRGVSRNSYIFLGLLWVRYNCVKFHHCRICLMWQILGRGGGLSPTPIREQPRKSPSWTGSNYLFLFHNMPCMPYTTPAVLDKMCVCEKYLYQSIKIWKFEEFYFINGFYRNISHLHILISGFWNFCWRKHIKKYLCQHK